MLLRLVSLVHQGLPSSIAKTFLLSPAQCGAARSSRAAGCSLPAQPKDRESTRTDGLAFKHQVPATMQVALSWHQDSLYWENLPVYSLNPSTLFPFCIYPQIKFNIWMIEILDLFPFLLLTKMGNKRNVCSFPLVLYSCAVSASLHHLFGHLLSDFLVAKGRRW